MKERKLLTRDFLLFERNRFQDGSGIGWTPGHYYDTYPIEGVRAIILHPDGTYTVEWMP